MSYVLIPHTSDLDGRVGFIVRSDRTNARVDDVGWFDDWEQAREEAATLYPDAIELDVDGHEVETRCHGCVVGQCSCTHLERSDDGRYCIECAHEVDEHRRAT